MATLPDEPHQHSARLQEIADVLGFPVGWLHDGQSPPFATEALEFLRLYGAITDAQGRQRVMNVARREAARCEADDVGEPIL